MTDYIVTTPVYLDVVPQSLPDGSSAWIYKFSPGSQHHPGEQVMCDDTITVEVTPNCDGQLVVSVESGHEHEFEIKGDPITYDPPSEPDPALADDWDPQDWASKVTYTMYKLEEKDFKFDGVAHLCVRRRNIGDDGQGTPMDPTFKLKRTTGTDSPL